MLTFGIIAALFVLLIFWFVLPPLFQKSEAKKADANASANVIIYQDQLEELAADCAADGRYEFLLVAPPLPVTNAVGTPINPYALK